MERRGTNSPRQKKFHVAKFACPDKAIFFLMVPELSARGVVSCAVPVERIVDVVAGGTELEPKVKTASWAGRTHSL
jgi:hypothetical protein